MYFLDKMYHDEKGDTSSPNKGTCALSLSLSFAHTFPLSHTHRHTNSSWKRKLLSMLLNLLQFSLYCRSATDVIG